MFRNSLIILFTVCTVHVAGQELHKDSSQFHTYQNDTILRSYIKGQVLNIFNEPVGDVLIIFSLPGLKDSIYCDFNGFLHTSAHGGKIKLC